MQSIMYVDQSGSRLRHPCLCRPRPNRIENISTWPSVHILCTAAGRSLSSMPARSWPLSDSTPLAPRRIFTDVLPRTLHGGPSAHPSSSYFHRHIKSYPSQHVQMPLRALQFSLTLSGRLYRQYSAQRISNEPLCPSSLCPGPICRIV